MNAQSVCSNVVWVVKIELYGRKGLKIIIRLKNIFEIDQRFYTSAEIQPYTQQQQSKLVERGR